MTRLGGGWGCVLCVALLGACGGESRTTDAGTRDSAITDGGPTEAVPLDAAPDAGAPPTDAGSSDAGGGTDLTVDVVGMNHVWLDFAPLENARIRVDGADGSTTEGRTDVSGRATIRVPTGSAPWTVTAAREEYSAASLIGVEGPIEGALHLRPTGSIPDPSVVAVSGDIVGAASASRVEVAGPGVRSFSRGVSGGDYMLSIGERPGAGTIRVLATEWLGGSVDPPPYNAAWLDIDLAASDLSGNDIVFPSPPRAVATSSMTVEVPTTGAVDASSFTQHSEARLAVLIQDEYPHPVGNVTASPSATSGTFDVEVNAFTGDMAPTHVYVILSDGGEWRVSATAPFADGSSIVVPAANAIEAVGSNLGDLRMTVEAPAHAHVGASILAAWYVYAWAGGPWVDIPWPELPSGMTVEDLGVAPPSPQVNVFAVSTDADRPWEITGPSSSRGIVRSVPIELSGR